MPQLNKINVELALPIFGKISGEWAPDDAERQAAWEMYVELATRVTVQPLHPGEGLIREALISYHSLFGTTRAILRTHGPRVAQPSADGDLSFGHLALAVLNWVLRPVLSRWHPELLTHEQQRPSDCSVTAWEDAWEHAPTVRQELETTRQVILQYADILALVADVPPLHTPR